MNEEQKAKQRAYLKVYRLRPGRKEKVKAYESRPDVAARRRSVRSAPEYVARRKEQRAKQRDQIKTYNQMRYYDPSKKPRELFYRARNRARQKGHDFDLTEEYVATLMTDTCPYTKMPFDFSPKSQDLWRNPWAPSLDRIDSSKGYVQGNVEVVSTWWNSAKSEWPPQVMEAALAGLRTS